MSEGTFCRVVAHNKVQVKRLFVQGFLRYMNGNILHECSLSYYYFALSSLYNKHSKVLYSFERL